MIEKTELRIRNWIGGYFGTPFRVDGQVLYWLDYDLEQEITSTYKPIPLTTDILKKAGFKKVGEWAQINFDPRMGIRFYNWNSGECDIIQDDKFIAFKAGHIKYLHQLQNLIHSLTGKELEIQL